MMTKNFFINLLALVLLIDDAPVLVVAQSSPCNSAEVISAPAMINQDPIQDFHDDFLSTYDLCKSNFSSSTLQTGRWFSYVPPKNAIAHIKLMPTGKDDDEEDDFTSLPEMLLLEGSCMSLTCSDDFFTDDEFIAVEAGIEYFVYVYRDSEYSGDSAFVLTLEFLESPKNDNIENAFALTHQDLPFRGEFTILGALSDFYQDACGLGKEYGVWFSYNNTFSETETLMLHTTLGLFFSDNVGAQVLTDDGYVCVGTGNSGETIEMTVQVHDKIYILVAVSEPSSGRAFELTLQSQTFLAVPPTSPVSPTAAPAPVGSAIPPSSATSCDSAQFISIPSLINQDPIQDFYDDFLSTYDLCKSNFSSSTLQTGRWFSYVPPKNAIAHIKLISAGNENDDDFTSLPEMLLLEGSCMSLTCSDNFFTGDEFIAVEAGIEYFVYVYRDSEYSGDSAFVLSLEYFESPKNDNIENAFALTHQDLPFRGEFTILGALSDFYQDACGLGKEYGVWFSYNNTFSETETLILGTTLGLFFSDNVGIQQKTDGGYVCVGTGNSGETIEMTVPVHDKIYILVAVSEPSSGRAFELTLQSQTLLPTSESKPDSQTLEAVSSSNLPTKKMMIHEEQDTSKDLTKAPTATTSTSSGEAP